MLKIELDVGDVISTPFNSVFLVLSKENGQAWVLMQDGDKGFIVCRRLTWMGEYFTRTGYRRIP